MRWEMPCIMALLLGACAQRAPLEALHTQAPSELLGTWRGGVEDFPVTLQIFGPNAAGLHAELEFEHPVGEERWTLIANLGESGAVRFENAEGLLVCEATLDRDVLSGECWLSPGSGPSQWLVVHL